MRWTAVVLALSVLFLVAGPATPQPWSPLGPRPQPILNGCSENAVFAILNTAAGRECLRYLSRAANVNSEFSLFCNAGRWGCCLKSAGFGSCKIEEAIPVQRRIPPPLDPG